MSTRRSSIPTGFSDSISSDKSSPPFPNPSAHIEFYKLFKRESDEYDNDFIKKYDDDANTTLIFVSPSPLRLHRFEYRPSLVLGE